MRRDRLGLLRGFDLPEEEQRQLRIRRTLQRYPYLAAERDGEVTGYIGANLILDEMYIANIAVEEQHRHRGAAMVLMRALVMAAQRENAALLTLEVRKSNTHAIDWYRRCGFLDMGIRPNFYTAPDEDALIMTKYLKKDET